MGVHGLVKTYNFKYAKAVFHRFGVKDMRKGRNRMRFHSRAIGENKSHIVCLGNLLSIKE